MDCQDLNRVKPVLCKRDSEQHELSGIQVVLTYNDYELMTQLTLQPGFPNEAPTLCMILSVLRQHQDILYRDTEMK